MGPPTRSVLNKSPRWPKERPASAAMLGVTTMGKRGGAMPFEFSVSDFIPARAQDIYDAWLNNRGHPKIRRRAKGTNLRAGRRRVHRVERLHHGTEPEARAGPADRPVVANHQIHRHRSGFADRGAAAAGGGRHHGHGAPQQCARRPHQLPRRRGAAQLFRADEATLQARTGRSWRVRGASSEDGSRTATSRLEVWSPHNAPSYRDRERGRLQVSTPPANRTAQMRTATSMEPTIPSHSL